jgi:dimethylargininase
VTVVRALVREIPTSFSGALCAQAPDQPIDVSLARSQHAGYIAALQAAGAHVETLPADEAHPDCVFVEDTAVIVDGVALITQPGAASRRGETKAIAEALARHVEIVRMDGDATLDGGDCMRVGDTIYVGASARTNAAGIARLSDVFPRLRVVTVWLPAGVLHLKCVCTPLGENRILLAEHSLAPSTFDADVIAIPADETYAANAVAVGAHVIVADGFPRTHEALARAGFTLHAVPTSEVRKADGSLTCQSLLY